MQSRIVLALAAVFAVTFAALARADATPPAGWQRSLQELGVPFAKLQPPATTMPSLGAGEAGICALLDACGMNTRRLRELIRGRISYGNPSLGNAQYNPVWNSITLREDAFKDATGAPLPVERLGQENIGTFCHETQHCEYDKKIEYSQGEFRGFRLFCNGVTERINPLLPTSRCKAKDNQHMQEMIASFTGAYAGEVAGAALSMLRQGFELYPVGFRKIKLDTPLTLPDNLRGTSTFTAGSAGYHQHGILGPSERTTEGSWEAGGKVHHMPFQLTESEKIFVISNGLGLGMPVTPAQLLAALNGSPSIQPLRTAYGPAARQYQDQVFAALRDALQTYVRGHSGDDLDVKVAATRTRFTAFRHVMRNAQTVDRFRSDVLPGLLTGTGDAVKDALGAFLLEAEVIAQASGTGDRDRGSILRVRSR